MNPLKTMLRILVMLLVVAVPGAFAQDEYIDSDLLDVEYILEEEQLPEDSVINRIYIFLAVYNGGGFDTYVADVEFSDNGKDITTDINDLTEYEEIGEFDKNFIIDEEEHVCFINSLPHFSELYPSAEDPFEFGEIVEVPTEPSFYDEMMLEGSTSLPIVDISGNTVALEHFTAFYNLDPEAKDKEDANNNVLSYGFIEIQVAVAE